MNLFTTSGPWTHVTRYQAEMEGPEEMDQPGVCYNVVLNVCLTL